MDDVRQISRVTRDLAIFGLQRVTLFDGRTFDGAILSANMGNNFSEVAPNPPSRWYAECTIHTLDGPFVIDYLDVASTVSIWDARKDEFEAAGIISIVE